MSTDQGTSMDSTKSAPDDTTEKTSPGRENFAGGTERYSQPRRSTGMSSRARTTPSTGPPVKSDAERSSRASPEKTNYDQSNPMDENINHAADASRRDEERDGLGERETRREYHENRDRKRPSYRPHYRRTGGSRPDSQNPDQIPQGPRDEDRDDDGRREEGSRETEDRNQSNSHHYRRNSSNPQYNSRGRYGYNSQYNSRGRYGSSSSQHYQGQRPYDSHHHSHGRGYPRENDQQIRVLQDEKREQGTTIEELKVQLARTQAERDQLDQTLKERTRELSSAQAFLGKADGISVTEASKMVELLNAEVQQVSALVADSLTQRKVSKDDLADRAELERALEEVKPYIGPRLQSTLRLDMMDTKMNFNMTLSQIVLQAGLINACARVIKEWNPPSWGSYTKVENIYKTMRTKEGQAIAGRWRALAYTYIAEQGENKIRTKSTEFLKAVLRDLLIVIGWSARGPHVPTPLQYEERIDIIAKKAIEVQEVIGKGVTSTDLEAHAIPFEEWFSPDYMVDADEEGKEGPVLCTIELGLRSEKIIAPGNAGSEQREGTTILKPRVMLVSALEEIRITASG